jgi:acyl-CoA synthetase (NDP forming)
MLPIIKQIKSEGRTVLTEVESKEALQQAGITTNETKLVTSKNEAIAAARQLGFPVVMKIISPDIVHKTDAGGIRLDLQTPEHVEEAYGEIMSGCRTKYPDAVIHGISMQKAVQPGVELIIGIFTDAQFGPVLVFGLGGIWTEVLEDTSIRITPITRKDASEMIKEIKGYRLLTGYRGEPPVNTTRLEDMLLAISDFVESNPEVKELDINPVIASGDSVLAVDARIVLENG